MRIVILLILMTETIINFEVTTSSLSNYMPALDYIAGRQYLRPPVCMNNTCVEEVNNVTCNELIYEEFNCTSPSVCINNTCVVRNESGTCKNMSKNESVNCTGPSVCIDSINNTCVARNNNVTCKNMSENELVNCTGPSVCIDSINNTCVARNDNVTCKNMSQNGLVNCTGFCDNDTTCDSMEIDNNSTCQTLVVNAQYCTMIINWTIEWITADTFSCKIDQPQGKYVKRIIITQKCSQLSNTCENKHKCELALDKICDESSIGNIECNAEGEIPLARSSTSMSLKETLKTELFLDDMKIRDTNIIKELEPGQNITCQLNYDRFGVSTGLTITQKCKNKYHYTKTCNGISFCSLIFQGFLESIECDVICETLVKDNANLLKLYGKKIQETEINGKRSAQLQFSRKSLWNRNVTLESPITCEVISEVSLDNIVFQIIVRQLCNTKNVSYSKCHQGKNNCTIYVKPCKDNEDANVKCRDYYAGSDDSRRDINLQWTMTKILTNNIGNPIQSNDSLSVASTVTCQTNDIYNFTESITIKQICAIEPHAIENVHHCLTSSTCSLVLEGTTDVIDCQIECSAQIKSYFLKLTRNNIDIKRKYQIIFPATVAPTFKYEKTILSNNDVIHVDEKLLSCTFILSNESMRTYVSESTKVHLRFTTNCNSYTNVVECYTIYGCNTSIAECYYLDRVHLTCAEYYSKKTTRMLLRRRIDGIWGQWFPWSNWNPLCGGNSTRKMTRHCDSPYPRNGGKSCNGSGVTIETRGPKNCSSIEFAIWSDWSPWSVCSLTCDFGIKMRHRKCHNNSQLSSKLVECIGKSILTKNCRMISCSDHRKKIAIAAFVSFLLGVPALFLIGLLIFTLHRRLNKKRKPSLQERARFYSLMPDLPYTETFSWSDDEEL